MLSVIIPTYNRTTCLYAMLQSLSKQTVADYEVLVVDQSDSVPPDKITRVLAACPKVRYYCIDKKGRPLSKNFAIGEAKGDVLIFCDDDIVVEKNFLSVHLQLHQEHPEVGALSCHLIEPHETEGDFGVPLKITPYGRFVNKPNSLYEGYVTSLNGGNMSFKKKALQAVGFFEERLAGTSMLEEPDMAYRLMQSGYRLYFSAQTKVKHYPQHNGNVKTMQKQHYTWLRNYFFNQYYFMYRNKRTRYFPWLFVYLAYRAIVEMIKAKRASFQYFTLPFTAAFQAKLSWQKQRSAYALSYWFTPVVAKPAVIHHHIILK